MNTIEISLEKLDKELKNNLSFWLKNTLHPNKTDIYAEVSIYETPNNFALLGAMYLSRILYGASTAFTLLENNSYIELAELSFNQLQEF